MSFSIVQWAVVIAALTVCCKKSNATLILIDSQVDGASTVSGGPQPASRGCNPVSGCAP